MKTNLLTIIALMLTASISFGQQQDQSGEVKLRGTRLTYPLVRKWISEFNKEYPNIKVEIAPTAPSESIDLNLAAYSLTPEDLKDDREGVTIARYVQLPIANSKRPGLKKIQAKGFTEADFNKLYFLSNAPDKIIADKSPVTLYTREKPACAAVSFARHFNKDPKAIKGVGVKGDDQDLAKAVKNDVTGISFNNLGFIYDVRTRKIVDSLAVIPIDLNENGKVDSEEKIYSTLDDVVNFIEKTNHPKFVAEKVNVIFNKASKNRAAGLFLNWILNKGQQFNQEYGFLGLQEEFRADQKRIVSSSFKVGAINSCDGYDNLRPQKRLKQASLSE